MSFSNYTSQALLNSLFGKTSNFGALGSPPTFYVGLSSTQPNEDGTNVTEPSGGGYARMQTASSDWDTATNADPAVVDNVNDITFPQATADWVSGNDLTYGVLYDAATGGNFLGFGPISNPRPVLNGDTAKIAAGDLEAKLT